MSFYESEAYATIKKDFLEVEKNRFSGNWGHGNTAFFGTYTKGKTHFHAGGCHAGLRYEMQPGSDYLITGIHRGDVSGISGSSLNFCAPYWDMIVNHSIFSNLFVTKDIGKALEDGFLVLDSNGNRDLITNCCIHTRLAWEYPHAADKAVKLFQAGLNPMLAMFIGQVVREQNGDISLSATVGSHNGVDHHWGKKNLLAYVRGDYKQSPSLKESTHYESVVDGFGGSKNKGGVVGFLEDLIFIEEKKSTYVHPFPDYSKFKQMGKCISKDRFYSRCVEVQEAIIKGLEE